MSWLVEVKRQVAGSGFRTDLDLTSEMTFAEQNALNQISKGFTQLSVDVHAAAGSAFDNFRLR